MADFFNLPGPLNDDMPFTETHVWQWAQHQPRNRVEIMSYLAELGFVKGRDRLQEGQYNFLSLVIDTFHRVAPRMVGVYTFESLLTLAPENCPLETFYVQGKPGRYVLNDVARGALVAAGWIYAVYPETTYFAVINGKLVAKYQQIIGSRVLAQLKDA